MQGDPSREGGQKGREPAVVQVMTIGQSSLKGKILHVIKVQDWEGVVSHGAQRSKVEAGRDLLPTGPSSAMGDTSSRLYVNLMGQEAISIDSNRLKETGDLL